jgi:hypothetical protein
VASAAPSGYGVIHPTYTGTGSSTTVTNVNWDQAWISWTTASTTAATYTYVNDNPQRMVAPEHTPEQQAALEARRERLRQEADERNRLHRERVRQEAAEREAAEERSKELFLFILTEREKTNWYSNDGDRVEIVGSLGTQYVVVTRDNWVGNVRVYTEHAQHALDICAHPEDYCRVTLKAIPKWDIFAAQILQLKTDEEAFFRRANVHRTHIPDWRPAWWGQPAVQRQMVNDPDDPRDVDWEVPDVEEIRGLRDQLREEVDARLQAERERNRRMYKRSILAS